MNDDSCLDCSDIPCNGCGYPRGDCHCTPEQVELAHHNLQQLQAKIAALEIRLRMIGGRDVADTEELCSIREEMRQLSAVQ